ncbi:threonine synthase [Clostridium acetireducens DSM 10703]|jgi:threonine synthase|uniref:Threonine synthase n=1 Tax=Clostridium acetireducens DSM 10703 TaxID=1121290 RepID=A0A1E8F1F0_9CLOT|nr:threonine synthase [Clostridium acetireducens]OFI07250.1 threonine synthase [Clostridium acetireducens DSM 10703]
MYYKSTRGYSKKYLSKEAIVKGIAEDGGLFVSECIPKIDKSLFELKNMDYKQLAYFIMNKFFDDFKEEELKYCIDRAYDEKFDTEIIAPVNKKAGAYFLELYHGPTIAFKDMALSILPYLLKVASKQVLEDKEIVILTATSGDTGKAALEGFANVEGTKIVVFFPENGVSKVQKMQMVTQEGDNTYVIGINGNFDDAQTGVKNIFNDKEFNKRANEKKYVFSSANSINIGRLIPQVVYYFYAYLQMCKKEEINCGENINVVVPTGNFGNILAAYIAKEMGLPIDKLICASNDNNVLYDFINTGVYDKRREFVTTISPSMDILVSSNLERLLYFISEGNVKDVKEYMELLNGEGHYNINNQMKDRLKDFYGGFASEEETYKCIKEVFSADNYLIDTHTAVAYCAYEKYKNETGDNTKTVIASTASPFKFTRSVMKAISNEYDKFDEFELMDKMEELTGIKIPNGVKDIDKKKIKHKTVCEKENMDKEIANILNI